MFCIVGTQCLTAGVNEEAFKPALGVNSDAITISVTGSAVVDSSFEYDESVSALKVEHQRGNNQDDVIFLAGVLGPEKLKSRAPLDLLRC